MYFLFFLFEGIGLPFWFSSLVTLFFSVLVGMSMNQLIYKQLRVRGANNVILLIASFALLILFESVILILFGADVRVIEFLEIEKGFQFLEAVITPLQLSIVLSSIILFFLFFSFMKKTKLGKAMRAVSDNSEVAQIVGISPEKIYLWRR